MPQPMFHDSHDEALADLTFGTVVTWQDAGVYGCRPITRTAVVLDVRTSRSGVREVLIRADGLKLPKWVVVDDVQFAWNEKAAVA